MASQNRYMARVEVAGGTEETSFEPLKEGAPRIPARYELDAKKHGRFEHGAVYLLDGADVEAAEKLSEPRPVAGLQTAADASGEAIQVVADAAAELEEKIEGAGRGNASKRRQAK